MAERDFMSSHSD